MNNFYVRINSDNERVAMINGRKGSYDKKIKNPHVRYGRNAIDNFKKYATTKSETDTLNCPDTSNLAKLSPEEFSAKLDNLGAFLKKSHQKLMKFPPLFFVLKYMPHGKTDKMALIGAAYEELGQRTSISTEELTDTLNSSPKPVKLDADVLDINEDGQIDVSEYSTTLLVSDMLSADDDTVNPKNIDGQITEKGQSNLLAYFNPKNSKIARETFAKLHSLFNLNKVQEEFLANQNNLVQ